MICVMSRWFDAGLISLLRNGSGFPLLLAKPYKKNTRSVHHPPRGKRPPVGRRPRRTVKKTREAYPVNLPAIKGWGVGGVTQGGFNRTRVQQCLTPSA
jgi:hypothetical protein